MPSVSPLIHQSDLLTKPAISSWQHTMSTTAVNRWTNVWHGWNLKHCWCSWLALTQLHYKVI